MININHTPFLKGLLRGKAAKIARLSEIIGFRPDAIMDAYDITNKPGDFTTERDFAEAIGKGVKACQAMPERQGVQLKLLAMYLADYNNTLENIER